MKLNKQTELLFRIAINSPTLCEVMGLFTDDSGTIHLSPMDRPWLHQRVGDRPDEVNFDPNQFIRQRDRRDTATRFMITWIVNVWNPFHASNQAWEFNIIHASQHLCAEDRLAISTWLQNPVWP